ncbi:MAG: NAD(P)/FAD-dependent oxidoreductase [Raineya sp.]
MKSAQIPSSSFPRIVIVGGGFAGLELVKSLAKLPCQVVLLDKHNHHTFQPLLYQVATSGLESASIIYPFRKAFGKQKNFIFRLAEVQKIIPEKNTLETSVGEITYDYLVLATGAVTNYYGMKEIEAKSFALKTIEDAILLRNHILKNFEEALLTKDEQIRNSLMDYVIVGGGPTGVEVAGALAELKKHIFPIDYKELDMREMDIHLIEASPKLLGGMSEIASKKALDYLEKMGVKVHLGVSVKNYDGYAVSLSNGEKLISKTLLWAAGVAGNSIKGLKEEVILPNGRVKVDVFNRIEGYENLFAIGDLACIATEETPKGHPMVAQPAIQQAANLGENFKKILKKESNLRPFKYKDLGSMATIGRNKAVVDLAFMRFQGFFAWLVWIFVHLMALVGYRNRVFVFLNWFSSYFSYDKSNRLIIEPKKIE